MELSEDLCFWCLPVRRIHLPFLSIDAFSRFLHLRHIACRSQGFGDPYLGQNVVGGLWFGFLAGVAWGVGEELQSQWAAFKDGWPVGPSHAIAALGLGLHALPAVAGDGERFDFLAVTRSNRDQGHVVCSLVSCIGRIVPMVTSADRPHWGGWIGRNWLHRGYTEFLEGKEKGASFR